MSLSFGKLLLILLIVLLVFGTSRLPRLMGDIGKSMRALRDGLKEDDTPEQKIASKPDDQPS
ncbi:MAG: twin-arginine translocase TatA/TatE family subunit [Rickettsiales bacterium]|nr:twin-arginine translocase TatA/TatE family subunit [Rickettsiales bacterium]